MQILETSPKYYRVQLPSGQVLTIARTPGTDALVQSKAGLAGGGVMPGEIDPYAGETIAQGVSLPELLPDPFTQAVRNPIAPTVPPLAAPMPLATPPPAGPMVGRGAVATVPTPTGDVYTTAEGKPVAETTEQGGEAVAIAESKTEGGKYEPEKVRPELDQDLARLMEPSWLPGEQAAAGPTPADVSELNRATRDLAETQAREQEALAAHYESMRLPEQPPNQPVNPGLFYENIGKMFGAQNPRSARIIGGIASGLMVGLGEIGAALSHRQNVAAGIIQNAISESIASQQNAQALTRQQWLDQTAYATAVSNKKIGEIAAKAKAPEIRAQAAVLIAKNNLAYLGARVKDGSMTAKEAMPLAKIEEARASISSFVSTIGTTPAGPGGAIKEKMGGVPIIGDTIGPSPEATSALGARDAANMAFLSAMDPVSMGTPSIKEGWQKYPNVLFAPGDSSETTIVKAKNMGRLMRSSEAIHAKSARGLDPKGAGTVTPGARPN